MRVGPYSVKISKSKAVVANNNLAYCVGCEEDRCRPIGCNPKVY